MANDYTHNDYTHNDYTHEESMPASATRSLLLWALGFGAGAMIVLLGGVLLVNMGVWGTSTNAPAAQSAAAPSGASAPQTTGQAPAPQSAPKPQQH